MNQAVEIIDASVEQVVAHGDITELNDSDLQKISGGLKNDGIVCWWEPGPGAYVRVCMCVDNG
jgi:bacteriocin-like protein